MSNMEKLVQNVFSLTNIRLNARQVNAFQIFQDELLDWNNRFNLTAIRTTEGIQSKHFLDSLSCMLAMRGKLPNRLIDIGTGAGFPGIPLKIIMPNMQLTLVESVRKKTDFCRHIVEKLGLEKVDIVQNRAEEMGQSSIYREKYDWAVARAVASLPVLVEYLLPLIKVGGSMLAQKGESGPAEAHACQKAVQVLGGAIRQVRLVQIPGIAEERYMVIIDKIAPTPPGYPRRIGLPARKPIGQNSDESGGKMQPSRT